MKKIYNPTGTTVRGPSANDDEYFDIVKVQRKLTISGGSSSLRTTGDGVWLDESGATIDYSDDVFIDGGGISSPPIYSSLDESIQTINTQGISTRVGTGTTKVLVKLNNRVKSISVSAGRTTSVNSTFQNFVAGSIAEISENEINTAATAGLANGVSASINMYSTRDGTSLTFVKNNNFWLKNKDFSCVSIYNNDGGNVMGGTLITPSVFVVAKHFPMTTGATVYFLGNNNTLYSRTIANTIGLSSADITLHKLNSPLPSTVVPAKIVDNYATSLATIYNVDQSTYYSNVAKNLRIPGILFNQFREATAFDLSYVGNGSSWTVPTAGTDRNQYYKHTILYDSGSPGFLLGVDSIPILISTTSVVIDIIDEQLHTVINSFTGGSNLSQNISNIESAISSMGLSETLNKVSWP